MSEMVDLSDLFDPSYFDEEFEEGPFGGGWSEPEYGPGECPKCGAPTRLVASGPHGPFFGCSTWPKCKGSRRVEEQTVDKNGNIGGVIYANGARMPYIEYIRRPVTVWSTIRKMFAGKGAARRREGKTGRGA